MNKIIIFLNFRIRQFYRDIRYADNITLIAESEKELKSLLMKMKVHMLQLKILSAATKTC